MTEGGVTTTLTYGDAEHPHAVTSRMGSTTAAPTSQPDGYTYDHDGNIASRVGGEKYTFDAEDRLSAVASYPTQTNYWYDGLGNMDCRWTTTPTGVPTAADVRDRYIDGLYEEKSTFGQAPVITKNYYAFGRIIAQRKTTSAGSSVTYLLADHLGSTVGTVSDAGVSEHMEYYPFGSVRSGRVSTDRGFTGQRREGFSRLGAYFYNTRFYATGLGHFMSADSSSADGLDRYAYVRFNPLRYSDPSGRGVTLENGERCPPGRPDCLNDGGPPPLGGNGGGCDENCQILHALADGCLANPGQGYCAGSGSGAPANGNAAPPVASPLPVACGGPCPTAPTDTPVDSCFLCDLAKRAPKTAARAACLTSMFCPAVAAVVINREPLWNGLTSNCVRGVTKVAFVGGVVIGSGAAVVETGGGALAAGWGVPAAAGAAGAVGTSEAVNLARQANRLWSNFQSGSQDVIDGCL